MKRKIRTESAEILRRFIKDTGYSQGKIADILGVSGSTISTYLSKGEIGKPTKAIIEAFYEANPNIKSQSYWEIIEGAPQAIPDKYKLPPKEPVKPEPEPEEDILTIYGDAATVSFIERIAIKKGLIIERI